MQIYRNILVELFEMEIIKQQEKKAIQIHFAKQLLQSMLLSHLITLVVRISYGSLIKICTF